MKRMFVVFAVAVMLLFAGSADAQRNPIDPGEGGGGSGGGCQTVSYEMDERTGHHRFLLRFTSSTCDSITLNLSVIGDNFPDWINNDVQQLVFDLYYDPDLSFVGYHSRPFIDHDLCENLPGFPLNTTVNCAETTGLPGFPSSWGQQTSKVTCNILRNPHIPPTTCPYVIPFLDERNMIALHFAVANPGGVTRMSFPFDGSIPDGNPKLTTPIGVLLPIPPIAGLVIIPQNN